MLNGRSRIDAAFGHEIEDGGDVLVVVDAQAERERALRIKVDEQHLAAIFGERRTYVDGGGGLAHATFLVAHGDHTGWTVRLQGGRCREFAQWPTGWAVSSSVCHGFPSLETLPQTLAGASRR